MVFLLLSSVRGIVRVLSEELVPAMRAVLVMSTPLFGSYHFRWEQSQATWLMTMSTWV